MREWPSCLRLWERCAQFPFEPGNQERGAAAWEGPTQAQSFPLTRVQNRQAKTMSQYWEFWLELQNHGPNLIIYRLQEQETVVNCCSYRGQQGQWKWECPVWQNKTSLPKRSLSPMMQSFPALWAALNNVTIIRYPWSWFPLGWGNTVSVGKDWGCCWEGKVSEFQGFLGFALCWTSTYFSYFFLLLCFKVQL